MNPALNITCRWMGADVPLGVFSSRSPICVYGNTYRIRVRNRSIDETPRGSSARFSAMLSKRRAGTARRQKATMCYGDLN